MTTDTTTLAQDRWSVYYAGQHGEYRVTDRTYSTPEEASEVRERILAVEDCSLDPSWTFVATVASEAGSVQLTVLVTLAAVLPLLVAVAYFTAQMFGSLAVA